MSEPSNGTVYMEMRAIKPATGTSPLTHTSPLAELSLTTPSPHTHPSLKAELRLTFPDARAEWLADLPNLP